MASLLHTRMACPPPTVEDAVDETPWALLGGDPRSVHGDPWQDQPDDVEPNPPSFPLRPRPNFILYPAGPASPSIFRGTLPPLYQTPAHAPNTRHSFLSTTSPCSSPADTFEPVAPLSRRTRVAGHECLLAARRTMDYINDAAEYARESYNVAVDISNTVYNAATSKTAQRTLLTTVLFGFLSAVLFSFACVGYMAFYHEYLPDQIITRPVHLQYGYEDNPFGIVDLSGVKLKAYQEYDVSVTLSLPNSPTNLARGNFMLALHFFDGGRGSWVKVVRGDPGAQGMPKIAPMLQIIFEESKMLHSFSRPAIMPYTDPLVSLAKRILLLAYHVFVPASETTKLVVPMVERLEFPLGQIPTLLLLDVQAGQSLQVYDVLLTITAQLGGLRWFMHTWWITSFLLFTALFWLFEVISLVITALCAKALWSVAIGGGRDVAPGVKKEDNGQGPRIKQEGASYGKKLEDVPMTFPTSSQQPPLRYDPQPGHLDVLEADVLPPQPQADFGGDADVEDEEAGDYKDEEEEDPQARDSGLGTSFSERDGPGSLRRRTSRRRLPH